MHVENAAPHHLAPFELPSHRELDLGELELAAAGTVELELQSSRVPPPELVVFLQRKGDPGPQATAVTLHGPLTRHVLGPLAPGDYSLWLECDGLERPGEQRLAVRVAAGEPTPVAVDVDLLACSE